MGRLLTVLAVLALLAACGSDDGEVRAGDERGASEPGASEPDAGDPTGDPARYRGTGMVLESAAGGPDLCFSSLDSYPPQCGGGVPLAGWDWSAVSGYESASGTRWGDYEVVGTWDGETLTVARVGPPGDEPGGFGDPGRHDFSTPCPEPEGGWAVPPDTPNMGHEDENAMHEYARAQPEYSASWVDNSTDPDFDPDRPQEFVADPAEIVTNFRFSADADRHEAAIRERWGGPICVIEGGVPLRELEQIREEVQSELAFDWSGIDEVAGVVEIGVVVADPDVQADLDRRYGKGTVVLYGHLRPVD